MKSKTKVCSLLLMVLILCTLLSTVSCTEKTVAGSVKLYFWSTGPSEDDKAAIQYFETTYGGKVEYQVVPWEQLDLKILADIGADTAPDVLFLHGQNFPRVCIQKIAANLEELKAKGIKYLDDKIFTASSAVRSEFTYGGKSYAVSSAGADPVWVFYNKTMFENNDVKTPGEYFAEGTWNWENFKKCAIALTADTSGDGKTDRWGYASWHYDIFGIANGGKFVNYTDDGKINLTLSDEKLQKGIQFMQDGYFKDKYIQPDGNVKMGPGFTGGNTAMVADASYIVTTIINGKMKDEWDFVPFPLGPDNTEGLQPATINAWGVCSNAKNPQGAVLYLKAIAEYYDQNKDKTATSKLFTADQKKLLSSYETKVVSGRYAGIANLWNKQWGFWMDVFKGVPIATAVQKYTPVWQAEIDATLADNVKPKVDPFNGFTTLDFEDGSLDLVTNKFPDGKTLGTQDFVITSDANEAITGKSLKITRKKATTGEDWELACRTLTSKSIIPAYGHTYKINFDYKMLSDMGDGGYIYLTLRPEASIQSGEVSFGWTTLEGKMTGDTGNFEAVINIDSKAENLSVIIGGFNNGDMVIDNISVVESK